MGTITREALLERIEAYRADMVSVRRQAELTLNALEGAIRDCEHWLEQLGDEPKIRAVKDAEGGG